MTFSPSPADPAGHWDGLYEHADEGGVPWFQAHPEVSLELIAASGTTPSAPVIDVGGGSSRLVDELLARGFLDVTVLDVSGTALRLARQRLGDCERVTWVNTDVLTWEPRRRWALWHDRAVFHFLTRPGERASYLDRLSTALQPGGTFIIGTFAPDAPERCSGLPVARYDPTALADTILAAVPAATIGASRREIHTTPTGRRQPFTWLTGSVAHG